MNKRSFLKTIGKFSLAPFIIPTESFNYVSLKESLPKRLSEEKLWKEVRSHYKLKPDYINLESGYYNIIPKPILENFIKHVKMVNYEGSYYMRNNLIENKDKLTKRLGSVFGSNKDELCITRNTTESLDLIIGGFTWNKNDEAIYAKQDYGAMISMFEQISARYGVKNKIISIPNHPESDEEIVKLYESKITSKTKLIMVCHMINITGQILPIKKICEMAHSYGIDVMVDGAHCIGHFNFKISDFNCDYYGSSLHKWLATPLGAGLLHVKKDKISKIWPLLGDSNKNLNDIKRLNHIGTHPVHTDLAINNSIDYLEWIGIKRKEKRLRYIKNYWANRLKNVKNIIINTPFQENRSCGIGNIGVKNLAPEKLAKILMEKYKIFTVAIDYANVKGCRISPNVFTNTFELDKFVDSMIAISKGNVT
ncbi:MAG: aminotransferase class V-fold PLP-dependent enzyme [Flavobacteriaceae bacterium]|tara:strand:- start:8548 stop:9816 length:1269 start_codon:yes stop_codon:yes gene_type:complete